MKIADALNEHPNQHSNEQPKVETVRQIEGPVPWVYAGQNFTLVADNTDESRIKWMAARLSYEWRRLVVFNKIRGTILGSIPASINEPSEEKDQERDGYIHKITAEWIQLENMLVHYALRFQVPQVESTEEQEARIQSEVEIVKSEDCIKKQQTIAVQDALNGFNIVEKMMEIQNLSKAAERLKNFTDSELEERAEEIAREKYSTTRPSESSAAGRESIKPTPPTRKRPKGKKHGPSQGDLPK